MRTVHKFKNTGRGTLVLSLATAVRTKPRFKRLFLSRYLVIVSRETITFANQRGG